MSALEAAKRVNNDAMNGDRINYEMNIDLAAEIIDRLAVQPAVKELRGALTAMLALAELDEVPAKITQERYKALLSKYKGVE
jgi:hypothetical protein